MNKVRQMRPIALPCHLVTKRSTVGFQFMGAWTQICYELSPQAKHQFDVFLLSVRKCSIAFKNMIVKGVFVGGTLATAQDGSAAHHDRSRIVFGESKVHCIFAH